MSEYPGDAQAAIDLEAKRRAHQERMRDAQRPMGPLYAEEAKNAYAGGIDPADLMMNSAEDSRKIVEKFVREHPKKFLQGARRYSFAPFFRYSLTEHVNHLNEEVLDSVSYMAGIQEKLELIANLTKSLERELEAENYQLAKDLASQLAEVIGH